MVVVDDESLGELLVETLADAGHIVRSAQAPELLGDTAPSPPFDIAILDLESRSYVGTQVAAKLRRDTPTMKVIALLPCGITAADLRETSYDFAIETPARLKSVLAAVDSAS